VGKANGSRECAPDDRLRVPTITNNGARSGGHGASAPLPPYKNKFRENEMPAAFFVVRATVSDAAKRQAFDAWYSREHLPDAVKSFGAVKAWRYWSVTDPSLHHAMYQFSDQAALDRAMAGPHMNRLIADFNRDWPDVTRTREVLLAEELVAN
jgi:hypothetical protein